MSVLKGFMNSLRIKKKKPSDLEDRSIQLPREIWQHVIFIGNFNLKDLSRLSIINKTFREIIMNSTVLWKNSLLSSVPGIELFLDLYSYDEKTKKQQKEVSYWIECAKQVTYFTSCESSKRQTRHKLFRSQSKEKSHQNQNNNNTNKLTTTMELNFLLLGDRDTGKSAFVRCWAIDEDSTDYLPNYDVEPIRVNEHGKDSDYFQFLVFDPPGSIVYFKRFAPVRPFCFTNIDCVLFCCSMINSQTCDSISSIWKPLASLFCGSDVPTVLIGCKSDLAENNPGGAGVIDDEKLRELSSDLGCVWHGKSSSFFGEGHREAIQAIIRSITGKNLLKESQD